MKFARVALASQPLICYTEPVPYPRKTDIHSEEFLRSLMGRQLKLSLACGAVFLVALLGLPLANYFFPEFMARRVFGFTLSWLILGVLFFPLVWIIAAVFIRRSIALEEAEVAEASEDEKTGKREDVKERTSGHHGD